MKSVVRRVNEANYVLPTHRRPLYVPFYHFALLAAMDYVITKANFNELSETINKCPKWDKKLASTIVFVYKRVE